MDYASATPSTSPDDTAAMIDFWKGEVWNTIPIMFYGMIIRTATCNKVGVDNVEEITGPLHRKDCSCPKIGFNDVKDGLSKTLLISEKFLPPDNYDGSGPVWEGQVRLFGGDDRGWSDGWDFDVVRSTGIPPKKDYAIPAELYYTNRTETITFGSAHAMRRVFKPFSATTRCARSATISIAACSIIWVIVSTARLSTPASG
jgi:hypothetical protein